LKARADELGDFALVKRGNRLSVLPVSDEQWDRILSMV
jgi:predicted RNA-binding protein with PUA-like domain